MDKGKIMASGTSEELKRKIMHNKNASLEDVFIKLTKKEVRDK